MKILRTILFLLTLIPLQGHSSMSEMTTAQIKNLAVQYARQYGIRPDVFLAQIFKESSFDPTSTGNLGEKGLTQVLESTAKKPGYKVKPMDWSKGYDVHENLRFGAEYLAALVKRNNGDYYKALQAYNGGQRNVNNATVSDAAKKYSTDILSKTVNPNFFSKPEVSRYPTEFTTATNERTPAEMLMQGSDMSEDSLQNLANVLEQRKKKEQGFFARILGNAISGKGIGSLF
jgi:hypothetical protein